MAKHSQPNAYNVAYYLDNVEISFTDFLEHQGASVKTRKNYKSDARHFLGWFVLALQSKLGSLPRSHSKFIRLITPRMIEEYKRFLLDNTIPVSTINRRLSTIRSFFHFCQLQGWISSNPTNLLANIPLIKKNIRMDPHNLLDAFRRDLAAEGASKATVKNYVSDVRQFLAWLDQKRLHN